MKLLTAALALTLALTAAGRTHAAIEQVTQCNVPGTVAPTYDDGPSTLTAALLQTLKKEDTRLTFYIIGSNVDGNEQILKQMDADQHQLAMHTFSHPNLSTLSREQIIDEVKKCSDKIFQATGRRPRHLRCPFGDCNEQALAVLEELSLEVIHWSGDEGDTNDWRPENAGKPEHNVQVYKDTVNNPDVTIYLQHDLYKWSVDAAAEWIPFLKQANKKISRVDECLQNAKPAYFKNEEWDAIIAKAMGTAGPTTASPTGTPSTSFPVTPTASPTTGQVVPAPTNPGMRSQCTLPNTIAPLFQDGPTAETPRLLDIAREHGVRMTFFLTGTSIDVFPDTVKKIASEGHLLALHTDTDPSLSKSSRATIIQEIINNSDKIFKLTGKRARYFQCPFADCDTQALSVLEEFGLEVIDIGRDVSDWSPAANQKPQVIVDAYNAALQTGDSLVTQSDHYPWTIDASKTFLPLLKNAQKIVVPVNECIAGSRTAYFSDEEWAAIVQKLSPTAPTTDVSSLPITTSSPTTATSPGTSSPTTSLSPSTSSPSASTAPSTSSPTSKASPTTKPSPTTAIPAPTTTPAASKKTCWPALKNFALYRGDLVSAQSASAKSYDVCCDLCKKSAGCNAFTFTADKKCQLKTFAKNDAILVLSLKAQTSLVA